MFLFCGLGLAGLLQAQEKNGDEAKGGGESPTGNATLSGSMAVIPVGKNILWDGGFDTGFGNGCWTTLAKNVGPSLREMWKEGALQLKLPIGSRIYPLEDGTYTLSAWVRRTPEAPPGTANFVLRLTNWNYSTDSLKNEYVKGFKIAAGKEWQKVEWTFEVKDSVRSNHHVEALGTDTILVDEVSLVKGPSVEGRPPHLSQIEAGFDIPEETRIYVDGEERVVDLVVMNHGPAAKARVKWAVYDEYEDLVKEGVMEEEFPAGKSTRKRIPMAELPYGGYRLASSVEGQEMMGDSLLAILPKIDPKAMPFMGADANIQKDSCRYMSRLMTRLGMNTVNALSCASPLARWGKVNPKPDEYVWQDEAMQVCKDAGMEVVLYFQGLTEAPEWVKKTTQTGGFRRGLAITDEKTFTEAYCKYAEEVVKRYGDKIGCIVFDDECNYIFNSNNPQDMDQLGRIYAAMMAATRKAAVEKGIKISVGTHGGPPGWLAPFLDRVKPEDYEFISLNSNGRPHWAAQCMEVSGKKNLRPAMYRTAGVGQRSPTRSTSLILDRVAGGQNPMGLFVWQALLHTWLNRPYGTENVKDGMLVNYGYYDMRTLQQTAYSSVSGKTGIEFDNSPTLGMQAMAMMKHQIQGMRPMRPVEMPVLGPVKPSPDVSAGPLQAVVGFPTGSKMFMAYPFRNDKRAVIAILPEEQKDLESKWRLSGVDFKKMVPSDLFAKPFKVAEDGSIEARDLPVYLSITAADLPAALESLKNLKMDVVMSASARNFEVGPYVLQMDPQAEGLFSLWRNKDGKKTLLVDKFKTKLPTTLAGMEVVENRLGVNIGVSFGKDRGSIGIILAKDSARIIFSRASTQKDPLKDTVTLRVGPEAAEKFMTIQEGNNLQAGKLRVDFGAFFPAEAGKMPPPAAIPEFGSRVVIDGFATFDLSPSGGVGFSPKTGFLWKTRDGEGLFELDFTLPPYAGGGSRGRQSVTASITIK